MSDVKFRRVSDDLIEILYEGIINIVSINEAKKLGLFTYKNDPITIKDFAKIINKRYSAVRMIVSKYNLSTGEEVIKFYQDYADNKILTYQGKPVYVAHFAKLINKNKATIFTAIRKHHFTTGEEIIEYYNKLEQIKSIQHIKSIYPVKKKKIKINDIPKRKSKLLTYNGNIVTVPQFALHINKKRQTIDSLINKYNFTTGEEIIDYYKKLDASKFTYQGELITIKEFAKLINLSYQTVYAVKNRYNYITGEEIIEHYKRRGKL